MDHTNYLNPHLENNNLVSTTGDQLEDHARMEDPTHIHHHNHHHQIFYDSIWPNFPLQLHHQVSSSSSAHLHYDHNFGHQDHHQMVLPNSYTNFMDQENVTHELDEAEEDQEELGAMKEMMYKIAAMQPVDIDPATIRKPKRRNVRISDDPQSVAARHRRERISEKIRILQRLVPGGTQMDTASMLDEATRYVKFLKRQIRLLQQSSPHHNHPHQACINVNNNNGVVLVSSTPSASNATNLAGGIGRGPELDWLPPPHISTSSSTDVTPTTGPALGFTAFEVSRGDVAALGFNHEVLSD